MSKRSIVRSQWLAIWQQLPVYEIATRNWKPQTNCYHTRNLKEKIWFLHPAFLQEMLGKENGSTNHQRVQKTFCFSHNVALPCVRKHATSKVCGSNSTCKSQRSRDFGALSRVSLPLLIQSTGVVVLEAQRAQMTLVCSQLMASLGFHARPSSAGLLCLLPSESQGNPYSEPLQQQVVRST